MYILATILKECAYQLKGMARKSMYYGAHLITVLSWLEFPRFMLPFVLPRLSSLPKISR